MNSFWRELEDSNVQGSLEKRGYSSDDKKIAWMLCVCELGQNSK